MKEQLGQHVILDFLDCKCALESLEQIEASNPLIDLLVPLFDVRDESKVQFTPVGYTYILTLGESHISMHTWPEKRKVLIDLFTCNGKIPTEAILAFINFFQPNMHSKTIVERGKLTPKIETSDYVPIGISIEE